MRGGRKKGTGKRGKGGEERRVRDLLAGETLTA